jgi:glycosyltransferase involved in cell wall biosynthesis
MDVYIASDLVSNNDIKLVSCDSILFTTKHIKLNNTWLTKGFLWQKGLLKVVIKGGFDKIVFLGDPHFLSTWAALLVARVLGIKTYLWTHGFLNRSGKALDFIKLLMYRLTDGIFLYGNEAKRELMRAGIKANKLHVIYNSLDYEHQKAVRDSLSSENLTSTKKALFKQSDLLQLVFVGRLTLHKKLDMLVEAVQQLNQDEPTVNLLLIGRGEADDLLRNMVNKYGINDYVRFYGSCHDEQELAPLICSSDICVSPGEIGLTAMHSLAYGVPVITHNNGLKQMPEYEAVIDGKTGYLFDYGSLGSLVEKIRLFKNTSPQAMKFSCVEIIEKFYTPRAQSALMKSTFGLNNES